MNAKELLEKLLLIEKCSHRPLSDLTVGVVVKGNGYAGTSISVVRNLNRGIDWDSNKLMIRTDDVLVRQK